MAAKRSRGRLTQGSVISECHLTTVQNNAGASPGHPLEIEVAMGLKRYKVSFDLPPRGTDEENATKKQITYLHHLGEFDDQYLRTLGKWQASALIDKIQDGEYKIHKPTVSFSRLVKLAMVAILFLVAWSLVSKPTRQPETDHDRPTAAKPVVRPQTPVKIDSASAQIQPKATTPTPPAPAPASFPVPETLSTLEDVPLPASLITIEDVTLLNAAGKEVMIQAGTEIKVTDRSAHGTLSMVINGVPVVGNESRIAGKVKLQ